MLRALLLGGLSFGTLIDAISIILSAEHALEHLSEGVVILGQIVFAASVGAFVISNRCQHCKLDPPREFCYMYLMYNTETLLRLLLSCSPRSSSQLMRLVFLMCSDVSSRYTSAKDSFERSNLAAQFLLSCFKSVDLRSANSPSAFAEPVFGISRPVCTFL